MMTPFLSRLESTQHTSRADHRQGPLPREDLTVLVSETEQIESPPGVEEEGMSQKIYEVEEFIFEFASQGEPHKGVLSVTGEDPGTYSAEITLTKLPSRNAYADEASELYGMDKTRLRWALNEICTKRLEEVAAAVQADDDAEQSE